MQKTLPIIIVAVIVCVGAFFGGMQYGQSKNSLPKNFAQNIQNGQQMPQGNLGTNGKGNGMNFLNGEVIAKDEQSLTIKTQDGSSKIVFFSDSTQISKITEGTMNDIEIGKQITINGKENSDGSYTASTVQTRQIPLPLVNE